MRAPRRSAYRAAEFGDDAIDPREVADTVVMPALTASEGVPGARGLRRTGKGVGWLMAFPALALLSLVAELAYIGVPYYTGPDAWTGADLIGQIVFSLAVLAWNASVPAALVALVIFTRKHLPRGLPVAAPSCVLFSAAVVAAMILLTTDDSSTGVLLLLFLPIELLLALIPFIGLTWMLHWLRGRRATPATR